MSSPGDNFASLGIDVLLLQPVARFPVDPIKTYFFVQRGGGIERNGARDQRKPKIALPVRTRRHWILLNSTRRANYTANFSKCLRPLSVGGGRHISPHRRGRTYCLLLTKFELEARSSSGDHRIRSF